MFQGFVLIIALAGASGTLSIGSKIFDGVLLNHVMNSTEASTESTFFFNNPSYLIERRGECYLVKLCLATLYITYQCYSFIGLCTVEFILWVGAFMFWVISQEFSGVLQGSNNTSYNSPQVNFSKIQTN